MNTAPYFDPEGGASGQKLRTQISKNLIYDSGFVLLSATYAIPIILISNPATATIINHTLFLLWLTAAMVLGATPRWSFVTIVTLGIFVASVWQTPLGPVATNNPSFMFSTLAKCAQFTATGVVLYCGIAFNNYSAARGFTLFTAAYVAVSLYAACAVFLLGYPQFSRYGIDPVWHPNASGMITATCLCVCTFGALGTARKSRASQTVLMVGGLCLFTIQLVAHMSKSSLLSLVATTLIIGGAWVTMAVSLGDFTKRILLTSLYLLLLSVASHLFLEQQLSDYFASDIGRRYSGRDIVWAESIRVIHDNPICGVGMGNLQSYFSDYGYSQGFHDKGVANNAHNGGLMILVSGGLINGIFWALLLGFSLRPLVNRVELVSAGGSILLFHLIRSSTAESGITLLGTEFALFLASAGWIEASRREKTQRKGVAHAPEFRGIR